MTVEDLYLLAQDNVHIYEAMRLYRLGELSLEQSLMRAVFALADHNNKLYKELIKLYEVKPIEVRLTPMEFERLYRGSFKSEE
jgi:hypothetical protein